MRLTRAARAWLATGCALGLAATVGWWAHLQHTGAVGYGAFLSAPERLHGAEVALSLVRVAQIDGPEHFAVEKGTLRIEVVGETSGLVLGEDLSLGGRWDGDLGALQLDWIEHRESGRRAKRVLGGLGLLLAAVLLAGSIRVDEGGLAIRG